VNEKQGINDCERDEECIHAYFTDAEQSALWNLIHRVQEELRGQLADPIQSNQGGERNGEAGLVFQITGKQNGDETEGEVKTNNVTAVGLGDFLIEGLELFDVVVPIEDGVAYVRVDDGGEHLADAAGDDEPVGDVDVHVLNQMTNFYLFVFFPHPKRHSGRILDD